MQKKLQVTFKKIGSVKDAGKGEWVEFLNVEPEDQEVRQQKGNIYAVACLKGRWNLKGRGFLKDFLNDVNAFYYQNPENSVLKNLEQAVKYGHHRLIHQFSAEDNSDTLFNVVVFVLWGNVLYIAQTGKAKALLLRKGESEFIGSDMESNLKEELFSNTIHIASGLIKKDDVLILGLPDFWKNVDLKKVNLWLSNHHFEEAIKKLDESFKEKKLTLGQALVIRSSVGIVPSEEENIRITIPATEEKSKLVDRLSNTAVNFKQKMHFLFKKKPLAIEIEHEKDLHAKMEKAMNEGKQKVDIATVQSIQDEGLETVFIPEEKSKSTNPEEEEIVADNPLMNLSELSEAEAMREKERMHASEAFHKPEKPSKMPEFIKKFVLKVKKKWLLIKDQIVMARSRRGGEKKKDDPNQYLKENAFSKLFLKKGLLFIILLVILLVVSIFLTSNLRKENEQKSQNNALYDQTIAKIEESKRVSFSDTQRQDIYNDSVGIRNELKDKKFDSDKIQNLENKLQELKEVIYKIVRVSNPKIVTDLNLKKEGVQATDLTIIDTNLFVLDSDNHNLFVVDINTGAVEVKDSLIENTIKSLQVSEGELYAYSGNGVSQYNVSGNTWEEVIAKDETWQNVVDMGEYYGNLYLLDKGAKQIWKYVAGTTNFSNRNAYLPQSSEADIEKATSISIDGAIYVLLSDGQVLKYVTQTKKEFQLTGLDVALNNPSQIQSYEDFKNIYILDATNKRVVVFDKNGKYQKQYLSDSWNNLKAFYVDSTEKNLYVINGTEILGITL